MKWRVSADDSSEFDGETQMNSDHKLIASSEGNLNNLGSNESPDPSAAGNQATSFEKMAQNSSALAQFK